MAYFFLYKKHPVQQNSQFTSAYQVLLHMKASDASKELQRHFRQGLKFQNFGGMCVNISLCTISNLFVLNIKDVDRKGASIIRGLIRGKKWF